MASALAALAALDMPAALDTSAALDMPAALAALDTSAARLLLGMASSTLASFEALTFVTFAAFEGALLKSTARA